MSGKALQQRKRCAVSLAVVALVCAITHARDAAAIEYVVEMVALEGDPAPRGDGTYQAFYTGAGLSLNNLGAIGFGAGMDGGGARQGAHVIYPDGSADVILNTDVPPTPPGDAYAYMGAPHLNDAGEFAFSVGIQSGGPSLGYAWLVQRESGLEMVAQVGDPVPGLVDTTWSHNTDHVSVLPAGEVLLGTGLSRTSGDGQGLFIIGESSFDIVVTDGVPMPLPGSPAFSVISPEADANATGDVVFYGFGDMGGSRGLYARVDGSLVALAIEGEVAPFDESKTFSFASNPRPSINDSGHAVFSVYLEPLGIGPLEQSVLIVHPDGTIDPVSREGDPVPRAPGRSFVAYGLAPVVNAGGDVIFLAASQEGTGPIRDGVYLWSEGVLSTIVEEGDGVPESGGATFTGFSDSAFDFNDVGVVAVVAWLDDGRRGVYRAIPRVEPVPMLAPVSLALLTGSLAASVVWALRRRKLADLSREAIS
jgi:hypothetical protein